MAAQTHESEITAQEAELHAVLNSRLFIRAPNLARMLSYICKMYFRGEADSIKEYHLATEALGRSADFDPDTNSSVRVEAFRLRKRLSEYYRTEGRDHEIQIRLPEGAYVPQFVCAPEGEPPSEAAPDLGGLSPRWTMAWRWRWVLWVVAPALGALLVGFGWIRSNVRRGAVAASALAPSGDVPSSATATNRSAIRIRTGAVTDLPYTDSSGYRWLPDRFFQGGRSMTHLNRYIFRTLDPEIYRTARAGTFRYDIPLGPGVFELRLHFAETALGETNFPGTGEASRQFTISLNGKPILSAFDVLMDAANPNTANVKIFTDVRAASDGFLHLEFSRAAILSGIEILPGDPGKMLPVRILAGARVHSGRNGVIWEADRYFWGGRTVLYQVPVTGTNDPGLYTTERWGHFSYAIPVASGSSYRATLHFSERYFGSSNVESGGEGCRLFDIFCNGTALSRNVDIYQQAGGENKALSKTFRGLTPNAQGKLVFSFVPVKNPASLNALEVVSEGPL